MGNVIGNRNRDFQSVMPHAGATDTPVKSAKSKHSKAAATNGNQAAPVATIPVNVIPSKVTTVLTPDTTKWENVDTSITHASKDGDPSEYDMSEGQMRREGMASCEYQCSQITKFVYVGGMKVAENLTLLREKGIRRVVNCANSVTSDYHKDVPGMKYLSLNLVDGRVEDISWFACQVIQFIVEGCNNGEGILVHCEKGISRSCSLVIAYKMWASGIKWKDGFEYVKMRRRVCSPNTAFTCNLIEIGEILGGNSQEATIAFRCAYHATYDTETPVLKMCRNLQSRRLIVPCTSMLQSKGVFVIRAVKDGKHHLFLWKGSQASDDTARMAEELALKMRAIFTSAKDIVVLKEGLETEPFLRCLMQDGPPPEAIEENLNFDDYFDFRPPPESNQMMFNADEDFPSSYLPNLVNEMTRDGSAASLHSQSSSDEPPAVVTQAAAPVSQKAIIKALPTFSLALGSLNTAVTDSEARGMIRNESDAGSIALPGKLSRASSYRNNTEDKDNMSIPISRVASRRTLESRGAELSQLNLMAVSPKDNQESQSGKRPSFRLNMDAVIKDNKDNSNSNNNNNNSTIALSRTPSFRAEEDIPPIVLSRQPSFIRNNDNTTNHTDKGEELSGRLTLLNKINSIISTAKAVPADNNVVAGTTTTKETMPPLSRQNSHAGNVNVSHGSQQAVPKLDFQLPQKSEVQQAPTASHVVPRLELHQPVRADSLQFDSTPSTARDTPVHTYGERPISPMATGMIKSSSRKKVFPLSEVGIISSRPGSSERRMFGSPRVLPFTPLSALTPTYGEKVSFMSPGENSHTSSSTNLVGIAMDTHRSSSTNEGSLRNTPTNEKLVRVESNIPSLRLGVLNDANRPTSPSSESSARSTRELRPTTSENSRREKESSSSLVPDLRIPKISDLGLSLKTSNNSIVGNVVNTNRSSSTGEGGSSRRDPSTPTDAANKLKLSRVPSMQLNLPPTMRREEANVRSTDKLPGVQAFNKPLLFQADFVDGNYQWRSMGVYDDEDLDESGVFLLLCPNLHHHLWIGGGFDLKACNVELDGDGKPVMSRLLKWAAKVEVGEVPYEKWVGSNLLSSNVFINLGGSESEAFWTSFNEGF